MEEIGQTATNGKLASMLKRMKRYDEYYTPQSAVEVILPYVSKDKTIWCPFDTESSQYVQVFLRGGGIT